MKNSAASSLNRRSVSTRRKGSVLPATKQRFGAMRKAGPQLVTSGVIAAAATNISTELSRRAINVLKLLAPELTGEIPPRENWIPGDAFLNKITMKILLTTRNCGPQTSEEIVKWAASRGVIIPPVHHTGKSLSAMWRELEARFAAGRLTKAEITEALERSVRRRSTKVPLALQVILLSLLSSSCE